MTFLLAICLWLQVPATPPQEQAPEVDPEIRAVIERFFAAQQAEDIEGYLALWSLRLPPTSRPTPAQLTYIFESGDDQFTDLRFTHAWIDGDHARVRVRLTRIRTDARMKRPDGQPRVFTTSLPFAIALVREAGAWKIVREGSPVDELAAALIDELDADRRRALLAAEPDLVGRSLVEAFFRRAGGLAQQQQYERAQQVYERSLEVARIVKDPKALGEAMQNLANSLYFQRKYDMALPVYEERLAMEREAGNDEGIASALTGIATIRYTTFEYHAALQIYRDALAIQERLDDQAAVSTTLISIGNVQYLHGAYDQAIASYRRAGELKRQYYDFAGAAMALEGLGRVYAALGDYASSLAAYLEALDERKRRKLAEGQATVLHSIAEIHLRLGNLDASRTSFAESRDLFVQAKDLRGAGRTWQGTALVELVAGRPPLGEKAYAESIAACTKAGDEVCVARAQVGLAYALAAQQKYADAIPWYRKAIAAFVAMAASDPAYREPAARSQVGLADALTGDGQFQASLKESADARHTAVALENDDVLWRALVAQARAERKLQKADAALGVAKAAVLAVRRMAAASLERPTIVVPRDTSSAYAALAVIQAEAGDAKGAFETAEEMRVHALRLWIAPNEEDIVRGMTEDERTEERRLSADLRGLLAKRERIGSLPKVDRNDIEQLDGAIAAAIAQRSAARDRVFTRQPALKAWRGLLPPATAGDLDKLLADPGQVWLSFVVDERDVVVFTARRPAGEEPVALGAHVVSLERQSLGERIVKALDTEPLGDVVKWREASRDVFGILPPPAIDVITSASMVYVAADDLLWRVPFEALPTSRGYLAEQATIVYLTSLTAALWPGERTAAAASFVPIASITTPALPAALVERLTATAPTWVLRPPETATSEIERIASVFKDAGEGAVRDVSGEKATRGAVVDAVNAAGAVHVAAPFRLNSASPLFSPVLLAADPQEEAADTVSGESVLDVRAVFNLTSTASIVTISDGAALSMRDSAAALPPVYWGWRAAGVPALLVRRWGGVEERSAALLERFYTQLKNGETPAGALHKARASIRAEEGGHAPGAWAGWILLMSPSGSGTNGPAAR